MFVQFSTTKLNGNPIAFQYSSDFKQKIRSYLCNRHTGTHFAGISKQTSNIQSMFLKRFMKSQNMNKHLEWTLGQLHRHAHCSPPVWHARSSCCSDWPGSVVASKRWWQDSRQQLTSNSWSYITAVVMQRSAGPLLSSKCCGNNYSNRRLIMSHLWVSSMTSVVLWSVKQDWANEAITSIWLCKSLELHLNKSLFILEALSVSYDN